MQSVPLRIFLYSYAIMYLAIPAVTTSGIISEYDTGADIE